MGLGQKLRVVFDKAYQDEISFASGVKLYQNTFIKPEQKTTLWGTIVYVPPFEKASCLTVQNGNHCEECAKAAYIKANHPDRDPKPYYCHYSDKGVEYTAKVGDRVCVRFDVISEGELLDSGTRLHKNLLIMPFEGGVRNEWMVTYRQIFLYERSGEIYPVGDNWIGEPVTQKPALSSIHLELMQDEKEIPGFIRITHGEHKGKTVLAQPNVIQRYRLDPKDYSKESCIVSERNVLGILNEAQWT